MNKAKEHAANPQLSESREKCICLAIMLLAALTIAIRIFQAPLPQSPNDASRWNTVLALVNHQTYVIDNAPWQTVDQVQRKGHFYSSKHPMLPTLFAGLVFSLKTMTGLPVGKSHTLLLRLGLVLVNIVPFFLFLLFYLRFVDRCGCRASCRLLCLTAAAMGTYLNSYCVTLNNHTIAAFSVFFALYSAVRICYDGRREYRYFAICGFFASFAMCNDIPAALFAVMLCGYLLYQSPVRTLCTAIPFSALPLLLFLSTSYLACGRWIFPFFAGSIYPGSYWMNPQGIDAAFEPMYVYLMHILVGHHGIFSLTPIFAFSAWAIAREQKYKLISVMGGVLSVLVLGCYVRLTHNYGGNCQGFRWAMWLTPFWLMVLVPLFRDFHNSRVFVRIAWLALAVSMFSSGYGILNPWSRSWINELMPYDNVGNRRSLINADFRRWSKAADGPYGWTRTCERGEITRELLQDRRCVTLNCRPSAGKWGKCSLTQKIPACIKALRIEIYSKTGHQGGDNPTALSGIALEFANGQIVYFSLSYQSQELKVYRRKNTTIVEVPGLSHAWNRISIDIENLRRQLAPNCERDPVSLSLLEYRRLGGGWTSFCNLQTLAENHPETLRPSIPNFTGK